MSAEPPVLEIEDLEVLFDEGDGVGPISATLDPGADVLLLGPSGSGKSTLLRALTGAIPRVIAARTTGVVRVAGRSVADLGPGEVAALIGVVAQDPETGVCLPDVDDEIAFPLENLGTAPELIGPAVARTLELVGAGELRDRGTTALSGGELQRIALATALVSDPGLLVLDEPTAMLDAHGVDAVREAVRRVRDRTRAAVVLVEHRLDEYAGTAGLAGLPARWIVLDRNGRVMADGDSRRVIDQVGAELLHQGCWLPVEAELAVLTGGSGRLDDPVVDSFLQELSSSPPNGTGIIRPGPVLQVEGLAVAAPGLARRPGRSRRSRRRAAAVPTVLDGIDLLISPGELVALVGANGSGKSSLLTCLAGLNPPVAGRISGPRPGLVFQNPEHQFLATSVRAEIATGLADPADPVIDELLLQFDLAHLATHHPFRLSGGQQRRLSLAAMLAHDRPFLLADEPGFGLDRLATIAAMSALRAAADQGRGVVFSSHDLRAVATWADRVVVVGGGGVQADVPAQGFLADPGLIAAAGMRRSALLDKLVAQFPDPAVRATVLRQLDLRCTAAAVPV